MAWQKGQSGNPAGPKPDKPFLDALNRAIAQEDGKRLRSSAEKVLDAADRGEPWAIQFLADRLDGKPAVTVAGDSKNPLSLVHRVELVAMDGNRKD